MIGDIEGIDARLVADGYPSPLGGTLELLPHTWKRTQLAAAAVRMRQMANSFVPPRYGCLGGGITPAEVRASSSASPSSRR